MGLSFGTLKASSNESIYYVHGRKLDLHISNNDGWNAIHATCSSIISYKQYLQDG